MIYLGCKLLYERNECVCVDLVYVLVEMWTLSRSLVTSRTLIDVVSIFEFLKICKYSFVC